MVQFETDHITASRALAGLTLFGAGVSVCGTKSGTVVIAADDAFADKLREFIGIEEPKKFRVFLAVASIRTLERDPMPEHGTGWSHYPWVGVATARNYKEAVELVYSEFVSRTCLYSDKGWVGPPAPDEFTAVCREAFVLVQHVDGKDDPVVFRSDPLSGKAVDPKLAQEDRLRRLTRPNDAPLADAGVPNGVSQAGDNVYGPPDFIQAYRVLQQKRTDEAAKKTS